MPRSTPLVLLRAAQVLGLQLVLGLEVAVAGLAVHRLGVHRVMYGSAVSNR